MSELRKPYVTVTLQGPADGGDFGPNTPGTRTGGIQEALDYAHAACRDVFIFGGRGGLHDGVGVPDNTYYLDETLRVPWSQDFRLECGNCVLHYRKKTGDAVVIDSQMNCRYKLGLIVSSSTDGAAVRICPHTPGPDDFITVTASVFDFSAICSDNESLVLDSSFGGIHWSRFYAEETNSMRVGIHVRDSASAKPIINNDIRVMFGNQHHATGAAVGLQVGDPGSSHIRNNRFETSFLPPRGVHFDEGTKKYVMPADFVPPSEAIGARIFAQNNRFVLTSYDKRSPGCDLVFEAEARDNVVFAYDLPNGITNNAVVPTNRVIFTAPRGFRIATPEVPDSGKELVNRNPHTVEITILAAGAVSGWTITDALGESMTVRAGLSVGQRFVLEAGDRIAFTYSTAPEWKWRALH